MREDIPLGTSSETGQRLRLIALTLLGFLAGISAFFFGFYDTTVWEPMLLAGLVILLAFFVARPMIPTGAAAIAACGLFGLGFWALASTGWADANDLAVTEGARWILYGVFFMVLLSSVSLSMVRARRQREPTSGRCRSLPATRSMHTTNTPYQTRRRDCRQYRQREL
mgnify:CR=1 FL=1